MSSNSKHWLCRCSSRWEERPDKEALNSLKLMPEVEAFKVWLAVQVRLQVEGLAQDQLSILPEDRRERDAFSRGMLEMAKRTLLELDSFTDNSLTE